MNLLLDRDALIGWLGGDAAMSFLAREAIGDMGNTVAERCLGDGDQYKISAGEVGGG